MIIQSIHAVLLELDGLGVLLRGDASIGKSEAALALIDRGHILIADDVVGIKTEAGKLIGYNIDDRYLLHSRYLGILDIPNIFSEKAVKKQTEIKLMINCFNEKFAEPILDFVFNEETINQINIKSCKLNFYQAQNIALKIELIVKLYLSFCGSFASPTCSLM